MERYEWLCLLLLVLSPTTANHDFRKDYVYNANTKAYYKLHIESARQFSAEAFCAAEGATLMVPKTQADKTQIHSMMKKYPDIGNLVYVGNDGLEHDSAEETPEIDLTSRSESQENPNSFYTDKLCQALNMRNEVDKVSCYAILPFACKVEESNLTYNEQCDTYVTGYKYYSESGSCYKASSDIRTWAQANDECKNEDSHLVVLNSEAEHEAVKKVLHEAPSMRRSMNPVYILAGISATIPSREFKTVFNQTLEEAGFSRWNEGEPNNGVGIEYCGSLHKTTGLYNDIPCFGRLAYICEKEMSH